MAEDKNAQLAELINRSVVAAKAEIKADATRTQAEIKAEMAERAADVTKLEAEVESLKIRTLAQTPSYDGPASSMRREFGHGDDLSLFPVTRSYSIEGKQYTEVRDGLLTSQRTYGDAHGELKDLWEAGFVKLALRGKRVDSMSPPEMLREYREHNPQIVARIADRVHRAGLSPDRESVIKRVFGVSSGNGSDLIPGEVLAPEMRISTSRLYFKYAIFNSQDRKI